MPTDPLIAQLEQLLALPPEARFWLANALFDSVEDQAEFREECDPEFLAELLRRSAELASGQAVGRSHEEIMEEARRIIECA